MNSKLALLGGQPVINKKFKKYLTIGDEEKLAVNRVLESGSLSGFFGSWNDKFLGGTEVKNFESAFQKKFQIDYAISLNSATSGLIAAVGAIGIEPGDEVIVSPWTMSASATAIVVWGGIPVFVDIETKTFNLDPNKIESAINSKTKAIMVPDIFGHAAELESILRIAKKYNLLVIEDASQAPGALYKEKFVGTVADIGVFSLNYHKHIHTGEGGVCVTNSQKFADRMRLIRNHAEAVVGPKGEENIQNMVGFNFRMGEIEAAIGLEQLKKLDKLVQSRAHAAEQLNSRLSKLEGLSVPWVAPNCTHVYYVYPIILDTIALKVSKQKICQALHAEGLTSPIPLMGGYLNIHLNPMFQRKISFGSKGYPWTLTESGKNISYAKGICPVAESLQNESFIGIQMCAYVYSEEEISLVAEAFEKVWDNMESLRE